MSSSCKPACTAQVRQALAGWQVYLRQPIFPASAVYVLLFFNAVLGPGAMMTAFLAARGLSGAASGVFRRSPASCSPSALCCHSCHRPQQCRAQ
jgi:hypothetical protein